jgi:hypothetical protein
MQASYRTTIDKIIKVSWGKKNPDSEVVEAHLNCMLFSLTPILPRTFSSYNPPCCLKTVLPWRFQNLTVKALATLEFLIAAASTPIMLNIASACKSSALSVCFSLF